MDSDTTAAIGINIGSGLLTSALLLGSHEYFKGRGWSRWGSAFGAAGLVSLAGLAVVLTTLGVAGQLSGIDDPMPKAYLNQSYVARGPLGLIQVKPVRRFG